MEFQPRASAAAIISLPFGQLPSFLLRKEPGSHTLISEIFRLLFFISFTYEALISLFHPEISGGGLGL